jgi:hypothetical protein
VARAKRTHRAEARRKFRAYQQMQAETDEELEEEPAEDEPRVRPSRREEAPVIKPGQRVGFGQAFKLASRPVHYIDDLKYTPTLITRTHAVWVPAAICLAGLVYGFTRSDYNDSSTSFVIGLILPVSAPPIVGPMVAGFFAPRRAGWPV